MGSKYTKDRTDRYAKSRYSAKSTPAYMSSGPRASEIKAIDIVETTSAFITAATGPVVALLNGVQTGAGFFNRVGSKIEMKNLHFRGLIINTATAVQDQGRIFVVYDRQPTGSLPTFTTMFQNRDQAGTATTTGIAEINLDNRDRFSILRDYSVVLPSVTNTAGVLTNMAFPGMDLQYDVNFFVHMKEFVAHYKSTSNPCTIADIATGALYVVFVSENADSKWSCKWNARLRYADN